MSKYNAIWLLGKDVQNVDLEELIENGVNTIFLNYAAFNLLGTLNILDWITEANNKGLQIHIWLQILYNNGFINPITNPEIIEQRIREAKQYAALEGVSGIHLDYIHFPGNAANFENSEETITDLVKQLTRSIHLINSESVVSASLMPEPNSKAYGQNAKVLSTFLDMIVPMIYKGNYNQDSEWIGRITNWYDTNCTSPIILAGLQTYKSDSDTTKLSNEELINDVNVAMKNGADGVALFRYGLMNNVKLTLGKVEVERCDLYPLWNEN